MENIDNQIHGLIAIVIAAILGSLPGWDRERRNRPAGLRTHMLVCTSAAMITAMSRLTFTDDSAARVVANIITGIGFLGSGIILQRKQYVYDVTSAASIWSVALLGIVAGYEQYVLAVGSTMIMMIILVVIRRAEDKGIHYPAERVAKGLSPKSNTTPPSET